MPSFPVEGLTEASRRVLVAAGAPDDIADQLAPGWPTRTWRGIPRMGSSAFPNTWG